METKALELGEIIFQEGDLSNEAYRLLSGGVEISITVDAKKVVLAQLGPGDIFGEMAMIDEHPRSATAMTLYPSQVEVMTPDDFNQCIIQDPATLMPYLASFFERLRTANDRLRVELRSHSSVPSGRAPSIERTRMTPAGKTSAALPRRDELPPAPSEIAAPRYRLFLKVTDPHTAAQCAQPAVEILKFPYRIGRAEHKSVPSVFSANDFVLHDEKPYQVSRNHCSIECEGDHLFVRDRGSMVGTLVNGQPIGIGTNSLTADLAPGINTLTLGMENSPFQFTIEVAT